MLSLREKASWKSRHSNLVSLFEKQFTFSIGLNTFSVFVVVVVVFSFFSLFFSFFFGGGGGGAFVGSLIWMMY